MAGKSFKSAPQPRQTLSDDAIDAFVKGGTGHDTEQPNVAAVNEKLAKAEEPTKRLSLDLPESVHIRFKTACSAANRKMVAEVQALIKQRTSELEKEAGISHK